MRAQRADFQGSYRKFEIVLRARRRCKVQRRNQPTIDMKIIADVIFEETESIVTEKVSNIFWSAGDKIIDAVHPMSLLDQLLTQMTA